MSSADKRGFIMSVPLRLPVACRARSIGRYELIADFRGNPHQRRLWAETVP